MITPFQGIMPVIGPGVWIDPMSRIIGNVHLGAGVNIWPGAVLRADESKIDIGAGSAVLDQCLIESPEGHPVIVGTNVLISHKVCLHGATVESGALVGIGAIVLDGAVIGSGSIIAAGSVVTPMTRIPPGMLALGQPAKPVRSLTTAEIDKIRLQLDTLSRKAAAYLVQAG